MVLILHELLHSVLILVLVDVGLGLLRILPLLFRVVVLILVLVDVGLGRIEVVTIFIGGCGVLILVLVDVGLGPVEKLCHGIF